MSSLGGVYNRLNKLEEAETILKEAQSKCKSGSMVESQIFYNLAMCYQEKGNFDEASQLFQKSAQQKQSSLGSKHVSAIEQDIGVGNNLALRGQDVEAAKILEDCLRRLKDEVGENHQSVTKAELSLGGVYARLNRLNEAEAMLKVCLIKSKALRPMHPATLITMV